MATGNDAAHRCMICRAIGYVLAAIVVGLVTWWLLGKVSAWLAILAFLGLLALGLWLVNKFCGNPDEIAGHGSDVASGVGATAAAGAAGLAATAASGAAAAGSAASGAAAKVADTATDAAAKVGDAASGAADAAAGAAGSAVDAAKDAAGAAADAASGAASATAKAAGSAADTAKSAAVDAADAAKAKTSSAASSAKKATGARSAASGAKQSTKGKKKDDKATSLAQAVASTGGAADAGIKPSTLSAPKGGKADDLKKIKGVGPKLEKLLHTLGFYHFDQVGSWTADEVAWVDQNLEGFKGRVSRDEWVAQAKLLAAGGDTAFSKKVDKGDVY